jgi:hypothetical protein
MMRITYRLPGSPFSSLRSLVRMFSVAVILVGASPVASATNLSNHGGPIMQSVTPILVFWLPPNTHFLLPPSDNSATDQVYENNIKTFFANLSGTAYLNITTQYGGPCSLNACTAPRNQGAIAAANVIIDTDPYPQSPLQDSDIHTELQNLINQRGLPFNLNTEFFVFTSSSIGICNSPFGGCSSTDFCAYHSSNDFNGSTIIYAVMPPVDTLGCTEGISSGSGVALSNSRELVALSHELFESITDPQTFFSSINFPDVLPFGRTAWWDSTNVFGTNYGNEIGDECNQQGVFVPLNGAGNLAVQNQWSNDSQSCVASFGPSVRFDITTGDDDLRGDSVATTAMSLIGGTVQSATLKAQGPSWDKNTTHEFVTALVPAVLPSIQSPLTAIGITLTSHSSGFETADNWNIENIAVNVLDPTGTPVCTVTSGGNPWQRLTGGSPTVTLAVQNCPPMPLPPVTFNQIRFVINTGGDDLRSDSEADASLLTPGAALLQQIQLKAQNDNHSWPNNSTKDITFGLASPQAFNAIGSIVIRLVEHNSGFETDDNWNIQSVNITLSNNGQNVTCFANVTGSGGNPFARLSGSKGSVPIAAGQGC